jgi:hypothetical protein
VEVLWRVAAAPAAPKRKIRNPVPTTAQEDLALLCVWRGRTERREWHGQTGGLTFLKIKKKWERIENRERALAASSPKVLHLEKNPPFCHPTVASHQRNKRFKNALAP